ncbi:pH-response regulator protein palH/rim21 [Xylographa carneopallida]|nr:pH-response regulator protein palH/rim21 [Xylographa carneopallida]
MDEQYALERRQIWARPSTTTRLSPEHCTPFHLPSRGLLTIDSTSIITLSQDAVFQPECTAIPSGVLNDSAITAIGTNLRDVFYASTSPQIYALATATVISYTLFVMLCIAPRTFFFGGPGGGGGFLGSRGMMSGQTPIRIGGRPWLQIVATLLVAISLTIATVNTFKIAEQQYNLGQENAVELTDDVAGSLELRIIRVISTTFLWLAQAQTLIRLFPRHREKITIKWTGFALIVLDTIFSILNNFVDNSTKSRPRSFTNAIPALDYLFELALSILYAACVIYYSFRKRYFAFYHSKMRNICMVAMLSLIAIMIPVVFFVLDIANSNLAGWGDYFRWVGAAAASVVVWEWVERIEALEREHNKDSILGDRVYDADEMITTSSTTIGDWPGSRHYSISSGRVRPTDAAGVSRRHDFGSGNSRSQLPPLSQYDRSSNRTAATHSRSIFSRRAAERNQSGPNSVLSPPLAVASPVSRTDTTSAASTIYAVRYNTIIDSASPSPQLPLESAELEIQTTAGSSFQPRSNHDRMYQKMSERSSHGNPDTMTNVMTQTPITPMPTLADRLASAANPFKRRRTHSVSGRTEDRGSSSSVDVPRKSYGKPRTSNKLGKFGRHRVLMASEVQMGTTIIEPDGIRYLPPGVAHEHNSPQGSANPTKVSDGSHRSRHQDLSARLSYPLEPQSSGVTWQDFGDTVADTTNALHQRGSLWISDPRATRFTHERYGANFTPHSLVPAENQLASSVGSPSTTEDHVRTSEPESQGALNDGIFSSRQHSDADKET